MAYPSISYPGGGGGTCLGWESTYLGVPPPPILTWSGVATLGREYLPWLGYSCPDLAGGGSTHLGWGTPHPPVNRQTPVKTVPSRRTAYAGGNIDGRTHFVFVLITTRCKRTLINCTCAKERFTLPSLASVLVKRRTLSINSSIWEEQMSELIYRIPEHVIISPYVIRLFLSLWRKKKQQYLWKSCSLQRRNFIFLMRNTCGTVKHGEYSNEFTDHNPYNLSYS